MSDTCETCRFWTYQPRIQRDDDVRVGQCRHRSPITIQGADKRHHTSWPNTNSTDFCGALKVREDG